MAKVVGSTFVLAYFCTLVSTLTITLSPDPVLEGSNLTVTCIASGVGAGAVVLLENGLLSASQGVIQSNTSVRVYEYGAVDRSSSGLQLQCIDTFDNAMSETVSLDVQWPPSFILTVPSGSVQQFLEGSSQMVMVQGLDQGRPPASGVEWRFNGFELISGLGVSVSDGSISFSDMRRNQSGEYSASLSNTHGNVTANFTIDVIYPPEFIVFLTQAKLLQDSSFVFNCTPVASNPQDVSFTFRKNSSPITLGASVTVEGPLLIITLVQRNDTGNYTCTATNAAGMAVVYYSLTVVAPPTMPLNPRVVGLMPFSATILWDLPSDSGGSAVPLSYAIFVTNTSISLNITAMSLLLTDLQHSTRYNWSVHAINEYGSSSPAVDTFNTTDSVPIISHVSAMALSLSAFQMSISLLTDGGQAVTEYIIEIRGANYTGSVEGVGQGLVSVVVDQLNQNFTKGENHSVSVFAVNSIGSSTPVSALLLIPFPPMTLAPPLELDPTNIPVCCAGVQLNLANPDDVTDVSVLVEGTLHPSSQVVRDGNSLYIMGLQAGTVYSLNITLFNIFGVVWFNTTVKPLLGHPSAPQVTLTPTAGALMVQLFIVYPGTREGSLQYSVSTSASLLSSRQTAKSLPVATLTSPVSGTVEVALAPGTYSATVTVTNQHGDTSTEPQVVTIPSAPPMEPLSLIIGVVVGVAMVILTAVILAIITAVLVYMKYKNTMKCCNSDSSYDDVKVELKGVHSNFEDIQLEPNPAYGEASLSKPTVEPQYEEVLEDMTRSEVVMEQNPSYQPVDAGTEPQTEEPVYL